MEIPNKVNQTVAIASYLNLRCLDKHNGVRTDVFKVNNISLNTGESIVQNRYAFVAEVPLGRFEPVTHRHLCHACKITRKLFVLPGKDVDTKFAIVFEDPVHGTRPIDADQQRRRIVCDGAHSACGDTAAPHRAVCRYHIHCRRQMRHRLTKVAWVGAGRRDEIGSHRWNVRVGKSAG